MRGQPDHGLASGRYRQVEDSPLQPEVGTCEIDGLGRVEASSNDLERLLQLADRLIEGDAVRLRVLSFAGPEADDGGRFVR